MRKQFAISFLSVLFTIAAPAQNPVEPLELFTTALQPAPAASNAPALRPEKIPQTQLSPTASAVSIPAGTRVLGVLVSPLHSTSGTEGSGVYLQTVVPVIDGDHVVIPAHTFVEGTVEGNRRPGHFNRTSEFHFRFNSMIFPNNAVAPIEGVLQSIPGSKTTRTSKDGELHTVDQTEKVLIPTAGGAVAGGIVGSVSRTGVGKFVGGGLGAGLGLGSVLLQRGDEINLPQGTHVEIVLRKEIRLSVEQSKFNASYVSPGRLMAPAITPAVEPQRRKRHSDVDLLWPLLGGLLLR